MDLFEINRLIETFKNGDTKKNLITKYGDLGEFVLMKYSEQNLEFKNIFHDFNTETLTMEKNYKKQEIFEKYKKGEKEENIKIEYGEWGILYLQKLKELLKVPPL